MQVVLAHVARCLHGKDKDYRPADQVPTAYAQVRGNVPETFDVFLGSVAPKGYAWIIPKGPDTANVGLGVRAGALKGSVKEHLQQFCEDYRVRNPLHWWRMDSDGWTHQNDGRQERHCSR